MPPLISTTPSRAKLPNTNAWLVTASLLLGLLWLGHLAKPSFEPPYRAERRPAAAAPAQVFTSAWRP